MFRMAGGKEVKRSSMKHSKSAATTLTSKTCDVQTDPVHLGITELRQVDKTLAEATQLVPLSEPSNGPPVQQNHSQKIMY